MHEYRFTGEPIRDLGARVHGAIPPGTANTGGMDGKGPSGLEQWAHDESFVFRRLWAQHHPALYQCCLRWMGGDPHEAQEALSNVALKVVRILPNHKESIANFKAWLFRLTYTQCMDLHRGRRRYTNNVTQLEECGELESEAIGGKSDQPEQVLLRQELGEYLQRALARLPLRLREPLLLRLVEGLPYQEIASQLALTPANARKRAQQARVHLRTELHTYLSVDHDDPHFTN